MVDPINNFGYNLNINCFNCAYIVRQHVLFSGKVVDKRYLYSSSKQILFRQCKKCNGSTCDTIRQHLIDVIR